MREMAIRIQELTLFKNKKALIEEQKVLYQIESTCSVIETKEFEIITFSEKVILNKNITEQISELIVDLTKPEKTLRLFLSTNDILSRLLTEVYLLKILDIDSISPYVLSKFDSDNIDLNQIKNESIVSTQETFEHIEDNYSEPSKAFIYEYIKNHGNNFIVVYNLFDNEEKCYFLKKDL